MFKHKSIYMPEKAVAQAGFSLLDLSHTDMNVSILDSKSKELKFNKFYWIVALVAVLFVGVSFLTQPKIDTMDEDIHRAMEF